MPEELNEEPFPTIPAEFVDWLNERVDEYGMVSVGDLNEIEGAIYVRLRSVFTVEEMHERLHKLMVYYESLLRTPGAMVDATTGEEITPTLRENFQGTDDELAQMLRPTPDIDSELANLLGEEAGEEE